MEIKNSKPAENLEHNLNGDSITGIIDEIFLICKEDKTYFRNAKYDTVEKELNLLEDKLNKQVNLVKESEDIEKQLNEKNKTLEDFIQKKKFEILSSLGSELWK